MRKKHKILLGFLVIFIVVLILIYYQSREYKLNGTYQGNLFDYENQIGGLYTINFLKDNDVNFFSTTTKEHFYGTVTKIEKNKYEIQLENKTDKIPIIITSKQEIVLKLYGKDNVFLKKGEVPIWEEGYEPRGRKPKALTPIEEFDVYRMHQEKKPISEITYLYKISASTVQRIVRRLKEESKG